MRIIRVGVLPSKDKYQLECKVCTTVFQFEKREATSQSLREGTILIVKCPVCHEQCITNEWENKVEEHEPSAHDCYNK